MERWSSEDLVIITIAREEMSTTMEVAAILLVATNRTYSIYSQCVRQVMNLSWTKSRLSVKRDYPNS